MYKERIVFCLARNELHKRGEFVKHLFEDAKPKGWELVMLDDCVDRVEDIYAKASVLVSASFYEGFGMTVLEGLASGCVVMASDIPTYNEWFAGYTAPISFVDLEKYYGGNLNNRECAKKFDWQHIAKSYEEVL